MDVNINTVTETTTIGVSGDIDGATAPVLQGRVLGLIKPGCRLIMDMTQVKFMSSAGLRLMLLLYRQITGSNGKLVLVGLSQELKDTMSATGFLKFFTTADTLDDGMALLNEQTPQDKATG